MGHKKAPLSYLKQQQTKTLESTTALESSFVQLKSTRTRICDAGVQNAAICQRANINPLQQLEALQIVAVIKLKQPKLDSMT